MNTIRWSIAKIVGHVLQRLFTMILRKLRGIVHTVSRAKKSGEKSAAQPTPAERKRTAPIMGSAKSMQDPFGLPPETLMKSGAGTKRPKG